VEQAAALQALGCEYAQGYFYGRPVAAEEISILLGAQTPVPVRR
jgi:EAL domain-containing protein (putative c-di-GMP-specific phosphodiesterase class I)